MIIRQYFPEVQVEMLEREKLIPLRGTLNIQKARTLLDYNPQNPVEIGFPKYIQWYKELTQSPVPSVSVRTPA